MSALALNFRLAARAFIRRPGFSAVAVATLALGIGANTAVFSVVRGVLLQPLPYPAEDHLVSFWYNSQGRRTGTLSQPELLDLQERMDTLDSAAGIQPRRLHLGAEGEPRLVRVLDATPELLPLLGVTPAEGRVYGANESLPDGPPVVVISNALRRQVFGESSAALGRTLMLSGVSHTVVGVMPAGFDFPDDSIEAYRPLRIDHANPDARNNHNLWVVGRLRQGVTVEAAKAEIQSYSRWAVAEYPTYYSGFNASFDLSRLRDTFIGEARTPLLLVLGSVTLVLLIACANVANLLLTRSEDRRRETAIRLAVGAERRHIRSQLMVESAVLSLAGAAVAFPLAWVAVRGLVAMAGANLPRLGEVRVDWEILAYTLAVAIVASLVFSLAPLFWTARGDLLRGINGGVRTVSAGPGGVLMRRALVVVQVALAVVLVTGAILLTRTLLALEHTDVGFATDGNIAIRVALPDHVYQSPGDILAFVSQLEERARTLPGVTAAGVVDSVPLWQGSSNNLSLQVEGRVVDTVGEAPTATVQKLSPGTVAALGLEVQRGRPFTEQDVAAGRPVALVNEAFVAVVLRGEDPFRTRVRMFGRSQEWMEIVGVVKNFRQSGVVGGEWPQIIVPFALAERTAYWVPRDFSLLVRGTDAGALASPLRGLVREIGPAVPIRDTMTLSQIKREAVADRGVLAKLVFIAASLALVLAAVGLYGVVALWVSRRTRELGLRVALGARSLSLQRLVLIQVGSPVLVGALLGVAATLPLARLMQGLLYEVTPGDPVSLLLVLVVLMGTAAVAAALPVLRAATVDPSETLRTE